MYIANAFDFDSDYDHYYDDSDSDLCCFDIVFVEPAPKEVFVVTESEEVVGTIVDIEKVVVGTKRRLHIDKGSTV